MAKLPKDLFLFLIDLAENNDRDWFAANKQRYEDSVREPMRALIRELEAPLHKKISKHLVASDAKQGGSMFRIHRDVRFSKDKSPYKTQASFQLRHVQGKDVHAPGVYVHLEPSGCFMGAGMYLPDSDSLRSIRNATVAKPPALKKVLSASEGKGWKLGGSSLKRIPRGFDKEHPMADELKRTSWILVRDLGEREVMSKNFGASIVDYAAHAKPLMRWLCKCLDLPF